MMPTVAVSLMKAAASGKTGQLASVRALHAEIERLQNRVDELQDLIGINMPAILDLSRQQTIILGMLFKSQSGVVASASIVTALYGDRPDCDWPSRPEKVIHVQVSALRKALDKHGIKIENRANVGYFMTSANRARVRALLDVEAPGSIARNDRVTSQPDTGEQS